MSSGLFQGSPPLSKLYHARPPLSSVGQVLALDPLSGLLVSVDGQS